MKNLKFSHEPILWIGLVTILLQAVQAAMNGQFDMAIVSSVITAVGTVVGRKLVTPVAKNKDSNA